MKFSRKLLTLLLVAVLALGSTMMVSAAGSKSAGLSNNTDGLDLKTVTVSQKYKSKYNFVTPAYEVINLNDEKTFDGWFEATGFDAGDKVAVLVMRADGTSYTTTVTVDQDGTFMLKDLEKGDSIAIVESDQNGKAIERSGSENKGGTASGSSSGSASGTSSGSSSSGSASGSGSSSSSTATSKSPKTGVEYTYVMLFAAAAVLGGTAVALRKHN